LRKILSQLGFEPGTFQLSEKSVLRLSLDYIGFLLTYIQLIKEVENSEDEGRCDILHVHSSYGAAGRSASLPACNVRQRAKHTVARTPIHTNRTRSTSCRLFVPVRSIVIKFRDDVRLVSAAPI